MNTNSLYDIEHLKNQISSDKDVPHYIAKFIVNVAEESCNDLLSSYIKEQNDLCKEKTQKLKMSLAMYGVHAIEKDVDKLYDLIKDSENFEQVLPVIQRIKKHLRLVKKQMLKDFKMVITLVN